METAPFEEPDELEASVAMSFEDVLPLDFDAPDLVEAPVTNDWAPVTLDATAPLEAAVALETSSEAVSPVVAQPVAPPVAQKKDKKAPASKGAPDEWGLFDPDTCGFAALLAKLDRLKHSIDDDKQEPGSNAPAAAY